RLILHHIISDFWSMGVLVREVAALYEAFSQGRPSPLPELSIQYADFACWQRQWMQGAVLESRLRFWRQYLRRPYRAVELPMSRPEPETPTFRGATHSFALSPGMSASLVELSRHSGATLFMTLLAAFKTLLYRLTRQTDILVGTDVANRNSQETEGMMGFFVNLLVLRTELCGGESFRDLLRRVRSLALEAYIHRDLPFDKLVSELRLERGPGRTPLVDFLFVFENAPLRPLEVSGLTLRPLGVDHPVSRFNLALFMEEAPQGMIGRWNYRLDILTPAAVAQLSWQFEGLLASIVADPDYCLDDLDLLGDTERAQREGLRDRLREKTLDRLKKVQPRAVALSPETTDRA